MLQAEIFMKEWTQYVEILFSQVQQNIKRGRRFCLSMFDELFDNVIFGVLYMCDERRIDYPLDYSINWLTYHF